MGNYTVVVPNSEENKNRYNDLIKRWWNWLYTPDRDNVSYPDVSFLRGDVVGPPLLVTAGIFSNSPDDVSCYTRNISIDGKQDVFFPVYHCHFVEQDPFGDGKSCGNIGRCLDAARNDYANLYDAWAKIGSNNGGVQDITNNLKGHYFESDKFTLQVSGSSDLRREEGFYLSDGKYDGVSVGTYMLLTNLSGAHTIDFGGRATNFFTRSVYHLSIPT